MTENGNPQRHEMQTEFSEWRSFLTDQATLQITLKNGDSLTGKALWLDKFNFSVETEEHGPIIVPKHAVLWYCRI